MPQNALKNLDRIGNGDEFNFRLCPKKSLVLAEKGCKDVYEIEQRNDQFANGHVCLSRRR